MKRYLFLLTCSFFSLSYYAHAQVYNIAAGDATGLITAIGNANADLANSVINLAAGSTYTLTTNVDVSDGGNYLPAILNNGTFTINGNGATLAGGGAFRVLQAASAGLVITLNNLNITGGFANATGGGAIRIALSSTLSLNECVIQNSSSSTNNSAVFITSNVALTMNKTTVRGSTGSGVFIVGNSSCNIQNSTFSANGNYGIEASSPAASSSISNCTISGNTTGGIYWDIATLSVLNSTIVSNGIGLTANITGGTINYQNCILGNATNTSALGGAVINSNGGNALNIGFPTWLNALADNGGATQTHAINTGTAPAVNIGVTTPVTPPITDQRATSRVGGIDAGAFEFGGTLTSLTVTTEADGGTGSLRKAMDDANTYFTGTQTINFNIQGGINGAAKTITLASALPDITTPVVIDGYTQTGASANSLSVGNNANLNIAIDGAGVSGHGFLFDAGSLNSEVRGVKIDNWGGGAGDIGIYITNTSNITVRGCLIGATTGGFQAINISLSSNINIGGVAAADRNAIAQATDNGIEISNVSNVFIRNSYIGTNAAGTAALANNKGVFITGINSNVVIGGTTSGEGNIISGNTGYGIEIDASANANTIQGNYIGTNAAGTAGIANQQGGVRILGANNTIGGNSAGARNVISANFINGILIQNSTATGNTIQGNYIGTAIDGTSNLGNSLGGVRIDNGANSNNIGGTGVGEGNTIAFTTDGGGYLVGITGTGSINNRILGNSMFGNVITVTGIDLGTNNITSNDIEDPDTGENNLQNFPEFTGLAVQSGATVNVTYKVPSTIANSAYPIRVEFFKADVLIGRQGRTFLGFDTYNSVEANANKALTFTPSTALVLGDKIVATATDNNGNTSEFSAEVTVGLLNAGLHPDDYAALVALYNATNGANWSNNTDWLIGGDAATWFGITTDSNPAGPTRRVTQISLDSDNLVGTLPIELGNLTSLQTLILSRNTISGGIPTQLGNLTNLVTLNLSNNNQLTGSIPNTIGNLSNLQTLDLSGNKLSSIPTSIGSLSNLREFYMARNLLTSVPAQLWTLAGLQKLALDENQITGTIPNALGDIASLTSLYLNNNQFTDMADFSGFGAFNPLEFDVSVNKLEFDDIKPNVLKLGLPLPKNYSPQALLGTAQNFALVSGASRTFTVSTPQPAGTTNTYQWFFLIGFSSSPISGATSASYTISSYNPATDAGSYFCQISNSSVPFLTLKTANFIVATNANGVFQQDYNALISLYNAMGGANWTNGTNWNTNADVSTWFGVTVASNRVTEVRLPNNNLIGNAGNIIAPMTALKVLDLSNNQLTGIDLTPDEVLGTAPLEVIHLNNNALTNNISSLISTLQYYATTLRSVDFSFNQISGNFIYDSFKNFAQIQGISLPNGRRGFNLSNNEIESGYLETDVGSFPPNALNISNNRLRFGTIVQGLGANLFFTNVSLYAPQKVVLLSPKSVLGSVGINFSYNNTNLDIGRAGCTVTQRWFRTTDLVNPVDTDFNLNFTPFTTANAGTYILQATATCVPGLTLTTETLTIGISSYDFVVDNNTNIDDGTYSSGNLTLREAIILANARANASTIGFNLPTGSEIIDISINNLPPLTQSMTIDGTSQAGYAGTPLVVINGNNINYGLSIAATNCKIYGLEIRNVSNGSVGSGIEINFLATNFEIGTVGKGNYIHDNFSNGILINPGSYDGKVVGNTISGNGSSGIAVGVGISSVINVTIANNKIGTDLTGTAVSGTQSVGIAVKSGFTSANIRIGTAGNGNIIGGNTVAGISLNNSGSVSITNNYIGTNPNVASLGNAIGIDISNASAASVIDGNTISGNTGSGLVIQQGNNHQIINNKIGTNPAGTAAIANGLHGIEFAGGTVALIQNNVISGNTNTGLYIKVISSTPNNVNVYNNRIGTDISGTATIPNDEGIRIDGGANNIRIGNIANASSSNTIAYNTSLGIIIDQVGTDNNTMGQNSIFCNGGTLADKGIQITNSANANIAGTLAPFTVVANNYSCAIPAPTVALVITHSTMGINFTLDLYKIDETCGTNQGKTFVKSLGSIFFPLAPTTVTVPLSDFQMVQGKGTYVLLARDVAGNSSQFSDIFTVYNRGTILNIENLGYADCRGYNFKYEITFSEDSPDGQYYLDILNNDYNDLTNITVVDHKVTFNTPVFSLINNPPMSGIYDIQGIAPYFVLTQSLGCLPNPQPFSFTPVTTPYALASPVILSAKTQDPTRCDIPNGRLELQMKNLQQDQFYFIDINGDGKPDFEAVQADNDQLIIDYISGGIEITSIKVTQPFIFCTSNVLNFSHSYPELPLPNATLLVYPDLEFIDKGKSTKVIVEGSEQGINYQLERADTEKLIGEVVNGNGGTIELPTEKLETTLTYRVLAKNKITSCSTLLETSATIGVDFKCIAQADSLILIELYRSASGATWFTPWNLTSPACTWFGVELVGDRVVSLRLANNDLRGLLPISLAGLPKLKSLDVSNNFLGFTAIEPLVGKIANFVYAPQGEIFSPERVKASQGSTVRISSLIGGSANKYQWFKVVNNQEVALKDIGNISGTSESVLVFRNVTTAEEGDYFCEVTSPIAVELILKRADVTLSVVPELSAIDIAELIKFFTNLGGTKWKKPWDLNQPISTWEGLVFESGNLVQINLPDNNLQGEIPNNLNAPIFEDLVYLNLSNNKLFGKLPESLKSLKKLTYLDLSQNDLEGEIPEWIGDFPELITLWLSYNLFESIHPNIGNLFKLRSLFLNNNEFETIPDEIGFLLNLETLDISNNYLEELTEEIGKLLKLKYLSVSDNFLIQLPESIILLIDLEDFSAFNNYLIDLPKGLEKLARLETLELDFNSLDFGDLEDLVEALKKSHPNLVFFYAPQGRIGIEQEIDVPLGSPFTLEIKTDGKNNTYQWYKDGKPIRGATANVLKIDRASREDAGSYMVFVSNKKADKLTLESESYIVRTNCVGTTANLQIAVTGSVIYCDNEQITTILEAPKMANIVSYQWFLNKVRINSNNDRINARDIGSYTVNLLTKENCVNTSEAVLIRRFAPPQVSIKADKDVLNVDTRNTAVSYEWFLDSNPIPNQAAAQLTVTKSGKYAVKITDANGCKGVSAVYNHILVSTEDETFAANLSVYPNPTNNLLNVESKVDKILALQLHDITGKKINVKIDEYQQQKFTLDINQLAAGVYLVEIRTVKGTTWKKVIKE